MSKLWFLLMLLLPLTAMAVPVVAVDVDDPNCDVVEFRNLPIAVKEVAVTIGRRADKSMGRVAVSEITGMTTGSFWAEAYCKKAGTTMVSELPAKEVICSMAINQYSALAAVCPILKYSRIPAVKP